MRTYGSGTALLVVDMQNDFTDARGSLHVTGAEAIVPVVNAQVALARASGAMLVYTQDWHPPRTPHFKVDGGTWPVHCVAHTWGAELHPSVDCALGSPMILKGTNGEDGYSGFTMRDAQSGDDPKVPISPKSTVTRTAPTVGLGEVRPRPRRARRRAESTICGEMSVTRSFAIIISGVSSFGPGLACVRRWAADFPW